ncbi:MAG: YdcH family protein [Pseudomonadota bacterium]|nr:YdcH family protein [Pseudomonadota bacterium]
MANTPHELHDEFPELGERITALKAEDPHFAKLYDAYHEVNRAVHRAETNVEPTDQFAEEDMRKERTRLKDELYRMLTATV